MPIVPTRCRFVATSAVHASPTDWYAHREKTEAASDLTAEATHS
jgi:hypothetical protein